MSQVESKNFNPSYELRKKTLTAFAFALNLNEFSSSLIIEDLLSGRFEKQITEDLLNTISNTYRGETTEESFEFVLTIGNLFISGSNIDKENAFLIGRWVLNLAVASEQKYFTNAGIYSNMYSIDGEERFQSRMFF
jgi:hypothetical protein